MLDHISAKENNEDAVVWKFCCIVAHEGPLDKSHPSYKGSKYNVMLEWETGEVTAEPLHLIAVDDPVTFAIYMQETMTSLIFLVGSVSNGLLREKRCSSK